MDEELGLKAGTMEDRMHQTYQKVATHKDNLAQKISTQFKETKIVKRISDLIEDRAKGFKQQGVNL